MSAEYGNKSKIEITELVYEENLSGELNPFGEKEDRAQWEFGQESLKAIEVKLKNYGYKIPVLQIERDKSSQTFEEDWEFELPIETHDIYEDLEYSEFCAILRRLEENSNNNPEPIRFRIDYRTIWKGITGKDL